MQTKLHLQRLQRMCLILTNIQNISSFLPKQDNIFLFDTNVLIKIFYPALGAQNSAPYIKMYQDIKKAHATLLISSIQISEFVNRCIRFQFDLYKESHPEVVNFKEDYRNTDDYKECMDAILEIIENDIFTSFKRVDDNFTTMNVNNLCMHSFSYDFNDAFIAEISRLYKTFLVTDDKDYANYLKDLKIITNNRTLLMFQTHK